MNKVHHFKVLMDQIVQVRCSAHVRHSVIFHCFYFNRIVILCKQISNQKTHI